MNMFALQAPLFYAGAQVKWSSATQEAVLCALAQLVLVKSATYTN
jgi:hypothetical protein